MDFQQQAFDCQPASAIQLLEYRHLRCVGFRGGRPVDVQAGRVGQRRKPGHLCITYKKTIPTGDDGPSHRAAEALYRPGHFSGQVDALDQIPFNSQDQDAIRHGDDRERPERDQADDRVHFLRDFAVAEIDPGAELRHAQVPIRKAHGRRRCADAVGIENPARLDVASIQAPVRAVVQRDARCG